MNYISLLFLFMFLAHCTSTFAQNLEANDNLKAKLPMLLSEVKYWGYQIQGIDNSGAVDSLIASHYDMLVLEPTRTDWSSDTRDFNTSDMVTRLKNSLASDGVHRKLVVAYIDIGEAEDWRWYWNWSMDWDCTPPLPADWPSYIIACDPDGWSGNYPVAYWDPIWKDIVIWGNNQDSNPYGNYTSIIDEVILDGFDGIYLDWVEAFEDTDVMDAAQNEGKDPAVEMISFIEEMRTYASARNPDFLIIQQNAASLCDEHPELFDAINAIAQEAIWYDGDADVDWNDSLGYDFTNDPSLVEYYIGYLDQYLNAGVPVFDCEYALNYADAAYSKSYEKEYIPYATRRSLGKLTSTPPPGYITVNILDDSGEGIPDGYNLTQNYPNPFNPSTIIEYSIPNNENQIFTTVKLKVYDLLGREVKVLVDEKQSAGIYQVKFSSESLNSGIYFYTLKTNSFRKTKKMLLVK
ncbi:MAG: endo alpha-1,4 polygalactosaminidase [Melioribacteraceae bacterium]|nr:endo alpha-1,4 polygalactosaminidase [Melioribacteraceae bacterium]